MEITDVVDSPVRGLQVAGAVEAERAIAEVKGAMAMARMAPRDELRAMDRIKRACQRPTLAEAAVYAFPRGDQTVTGPSIRLAEAIAQNWGNIQTGIRELSQEDGESTVEAFAWDLETNYRASKTFTVKHERHTRKGVTRLTDPRDIYEKVANDGSRRLRACILAVIPADVTEDAVKECETTLANSTPVDAVQIKKIADAFSEFGVTVPMIELRIGHRLTVEATITAELLALRRVYTSIRDGMGKAGDYFPGAGESEQPASLDEIKAGLRTMAADPALHADGKKAIDAALAKATTPDAELRDLYDQAKRALERAKKGAKA